MSYTPIMLGRPVFLGLTTGVGLPLLLRQRQPRMCDGLAPGSMAIKAQQYEHDATVPIFRHGRFNRAAIGQLSSGSIAGVLGGLAVSMFSRSLAALIGMSIFVIQWLSSKGYNVIPVGKIQKYIKGVNVRSALENNIAFKLSFGLTFALAAFGSLKQDY